MYLKNLPKTIVLIGYLSKMLYKKNFTYEAQCIKMDLNTRENEYFNLNVKENLYLGDNPLNTYLSHLFNGVFTWLIVLTFILSFYSNPFWHTVKSSKVTNLWFSRSLYKIRHIGDGWVAASTPTRLETRNQCQRIFKVWHPGRCRLLCTMRQEIQTVSRHY